MSLLAQLASLGAAGMMLLSVPLDAAAPQNDADSTLFLVNRQWTVTESYEPENLRQAQVPGSVRQMRDEAAAALEEMFAACKEEIGVTLISVSGYRSYTKQNNIYQRKLRAVKKNVAKAQEYVAPPGASEHQLGLIRPAGSGRMKTAGGSGSSSATEKTGRISPATSTNRGISGMSGKRSRRKSMRRIFPMKHG